MCPSRGWKYKPLDDGLDEPDDLYVIDKVLDTELARFTHGAVCGGRGLLKLFKVAGLVP